MSPLYRISILQCQRALCDQFILLMKDSLSTKLNSFLIESIVPTRYKNIKEPMYELPNHALSTYIVLCLLLGNRPLVTINFVKYGGNCAQVPGSRHSHEDSPLSGGEIKQVEFLFLNTAKRDMIFY
jgi:hypothetical protein